MHLERRKGIARAGWATPRATFLVWAVGLALAGSHALGSESISTPPRTAVPEVREVEESALRIQSALLQLRQDPTSQAPHFELGETYYALGNLPAARHHLETYLAGQPAGPDSVRAAYLHARTLLASGLKLRATRALRALVTNPNAPAAADHDLALLLREDNFGAEAVMEEMRALERGGKTPTYLREAAHQWKEIRSLDQAGTFFRMLTDGGTEVTAEDWFQLAYVAHRMKYFPLAGEAYQTCLSLDPGHAEAHYNAAMVAEHDDRNDTAAFHLEQVLRLRPHYEPAYFQLGRLFLKQERNIEAASVFRRFIDVSQDSLAIAEARDLIRNLSGEAEASAQ
ncbi:MAG: tetratricopeptide repeat protein [Candidatus Eisenbacteria bacterium]